MASNSQRPQFSRGAVLDYLARQFGGLVRESHRTVSAGLAVLSAAGPDPERVSLTFINLGVSETFVQPGPNASATAGIRLAASGGGVSFSVVEDGVLPSLDWTCLSVAAAQDLFVIEVRREQAE